MTTNYEIISVESIIYGPLFKQRKLFYKEEIVQLRRADIIECGGLDSKYAIRVRKVDDTTFQVIDGNLRLMICKSENIATIPCYIEDMTIVEGIVAFVSANQAHGISVLLIGLADLECERERGGRGRRGSQRGELCDQWHINKSNLTRYRQGAEVYKYVEESMDLKELQELERRCYKLHKIYKLPRGNWLKAAQLVVKNNNFDHVDKADNLTKRLVTVENADIISTIIPVEQAVHCSMRNETGSIPITVAVNEINKAIKILHDQNRQDEIPELVNKLRDGIFSQKKSRNFFNFRATADKCREAVNAGSTDNTDYQQILNCDARVFLNGLPDNSVQFALLDAPWGVQKNSISRPGQTVASDNPREAFQLYIDIAPVVARIIKDTGYVAMFYAPQFMIQTIAPFIQHGFMPTNCTWIKSSHTIGHLTGNPLVQSESFVLMKKTNNAVWMQANSNVYIYPSVSRNCRISPCQKNDLLLRDLILSSSSKGDLVIEPFLGSGETLRVARSLGRKIAGSEISESLYASAWNNIFSEERSEAV